MSDIARRVAIASTVGLLAAAVVVVAATRSDDLQNEDATESSADRGTSQSSTRGWRRLRPSPLERTEVAAARIGKRIYVVGGFEPPGETTNAVATYNTRRDRWKRVKRLPAGVNHATATAHRGRLYVHGGFTDPSGLGGAANQLYSYKPKRNRWKRLPDSPTPRAAHALGAIGGKLYVAGGTNSSSDRLTSLEIYDISKRKWASGPDMGVGRNHVAGAVLDGRFYVLGGRPGSLDTVEAFAPKQGEWSRVAPMNTPRSGFAAVTVRSGIVAFGGEELGPGGTTIEQVERYDPGTDTWTALPDMRTPRHGLGGASRKRRVFALEGGPQPGFAFSDLVEFLDVPER